MSFGTAAGTDANTSLDGNGTTTGIRHLTLRLGDTRPDGGRDLGSESVKIYLIGNTLHVDGVRTGDDVTIYTISGQLFMRSKATDNGFSTTLSRGVYVVKADGKGKAVGVK